MSADPVQQTETTVDLLRHGAPVGGRKYRGSTDDPLDETGWDQMRRATGERRVWDRVVSSPLSRCAAFGEWLAEAHGVPFHVDAGFQEMYYGQWEGYASEVIRREYAGELAQFWSDPTSYTPPGAERAAAFLERVAGAWERLLAGYPGERLLVVAHAGTIRAVLLQVLGLPVQRLFRIDVPYACLTRIRVDAARGCWQPRLLFHNGRLPD